MKLIDWTDDTCMATVGQLDQRDGHVMNAIGKSLLVFLLATVAILQKSPSQAAAWPERNVRIIVASAAGSSIDLAARVYAERLTLRWQRPIVVDNRAGADGILAVQSLMQATDGHTLLCAFPGVVTVVPLLHRELSYDPLRDLVPITSVAKDFLAIATTVTLPGGSLDELIAVARSRPGQLNWAAAPGAPYLTFLEFQRREGITLAHVPYRSSNLALPDLMKGEIHVAVLPLSSALPLAHGGKLKLLAVTALNRSPAAPDVPTVNEAGFPELTVDAPLGLFGRRDMPVDLRVRIASDVAAAADEPAIRNRLEAAGMLAKTSTPDEYVATLAEQRARWTALAQTYGVRPQ
jgi:tripartite-type tricarboxylate transporter receptor subunit TctC